ncbi:hypothetical protein [uncultured Nostoc sp.]|nr:hypothetical protein [uncultured Nostoc sp.]
MRFPICNMFKAIALNYLDFAIFAVYRKYGDRLFEIDNLAS